MIEASYTRFDFAPSYAGDLKSQSDVVYAIGDVHGMDDLLARMLAMIDADAADRASRYTVVFLGDLVNRGPQTKQVLQRIIMGPTRPACTWIVLRGNHEQAMLDALTRPNESCIPRWLKRGGRAALESYGGTGKDISTARARDLVGEEHVALLASLPLTYLVGDHLFVHAGVSPGIPLEKQSADTLMNIRSPFLKKRHKLPYTVVHGHTPTSGDPLIGPNRIGVDTGACMTGILTSIAVDAATNRHRFLRVKS